MLSLFWNLRVSIIYDGPLPVPITCLKAISLNFFKILQTLGSLRENIKTIIWHKKQTLILKFIEFLSYVHEGFENNPRTKICMLNYLLTLCGRKATTCGWSKYIHVASRAWLGRDSTICLPSFPCWIAILSYPSHALRSDLNTVV